MRRLALAIVVIGTISATAPARAQTYSPNYPVCLHVYGPVTYYECGYSSLAQCAMSASGRTAPCEPNPYVANASEPLGPARRRHRAY
jgi:uncharacterized protein DUF3551